MGFRRSWAVGWGLVGLEPSRAVGLLGLSIRARAGMGLGYGHGSATWQLAGHGRGWQQQAPLGAVSARTVANRHDHAPNPPTIARATQRARKRATMQPTETLHVSRACIAQVHVDLLDLDLVAIGTLARVSFFAWVGL